MIILMTAVTGCVSIHSENQTQISQKEKTRNEIIQLYQEIITLRQQVLADMEKSLEYGRGDVTDYMDARTKLTEARIELAQYEGRPDAVIKEFENIIQLYSEMNESLQKEIAAGQRPSRDLYEVDIAILEAKIRLAKAKLK